MFLDKIKGALGIKKPAKQAEPPASVQKKSRRARGGKTRSARKVEKEVNAVLAAANGIHMEPGVETKISVPRWPGKRAERMLKDVHCIVCLARHMAGGYPDGPKEKYLTIAREA